MIYDIFKLEELIVKKGIFSLGYVIFLTNDYLYWEKGDDKSYDKQFHLNNNREFTGLLEWDKRTAKGTTKGHEGLTVTKSYKCFWRDFSKLNINYSEFKYLLFEIK